jgi:hypothetical protein
MQQWVAKSRLTWFSAFPNSLPMAFSTSIHFFRSQKASTTIFCIYSSVVKLGRKFNTCTKPVCLPWTLQLGPLSVPQQTFLDSQGGQCLLHRIYMSELCQPISQVHQIEEEDEELVVTNLSRLSLMSLWCTPLDLRWRSSLLAFYKWYHFDHRSNISNKRIWTSTWFQVDWNLQPLKIYEKLTILQNLFTSFWINFARV